MPKIEIECNDASLPSLILVKQYPHPTEENHNILTQDDFVVMRIAEVFGWTTMQANLQTGE